MYEIENENVYNNFSKYKEMSDFSYYTAKSKHYHDSNTLVIGKMKDKIGNIATEEFLGLKPKIQLILVSNFSEDKKVKGVNKNVVATICHSGYKDTLLNKK